MSRTNAWRTKAKKVGEALKTPQRTVSLYEVSLESKEAKWPIFSGKIMRRPARNIPKLNVT